MANTKPKKHWLTKKLAKTMTLEELEKLIEEGVNVNAQFDDSDSGETVLMALLDRHNGEDLLEIVKALVNAGATLNNFSKDFGYTELMRAIGSVRSMEIVQFLIDSGADVNFSGGMGNVPLTVLSFSSIATGSKKYKAKQALCTEYTRALLKAGANPNLPLVWKDPLSDHTRPIVLFDSLCSTNSGMPIESFKLLLDAGAKINNKNGKSTALSASICPIASMNVELCKLLLDSGAKPNAEFFRNLTGHSHPDYRSEKINIAIRKDCEEIRECLAKHNIPDKSEK